MDSDSLQTLVNVASISQIVQLNNLLHDRVFDLDDLSFRAGVVVVPFAEELHEERTVVKKGLLRTTYAIPRVKSLLEINNVVSLDVVDKAKVGLFEFSEIKWLPQSELIIDAVPALRLELRVRELSIRVHRTNVQLPARHVKSLFGGFAEATRQE